MNKNAFKASFDLEESCSGWFARKELAIRMIKGQYFFSGNNKQFTNTRWIFDYYLLNREKILNDGS